MKTASINLVRSSTTNFFEKDRSSASQSRVETEEFDSGGRSSYQINAGKKITESFRKDRIQALMKDLKINYPRE